MVSEIVPNIDTGKVVVIGLIMGTYNENWLENYKNEKTVTFPLFMMEENLYADYEIGWAYGNYAPSYFIIDQDGIIQKRYDSLYGIADQILADLETLVN